MNKLNNNKTTWAWSALCLVALGLTTGTGCDLQGTDSQSALEAAMNPSAAMARFAMPVALTRAELAGTDSRLINPVNDSRTEQADGAFQLISPVESPRLEAGEAVGIELLRG